MLKKDERGFRLEDATCIRATSKAILVQHTDLPDGQMWVPQSVVSDDSEVYREGDEGELVIAEWWANSNGLT